VSQQGIAVARMTLADRFTPAGSVWKYHDGNWTEPGLRGLVTPILPTTTAWQRANTDSFWGPSIHWNRHLESCEHSGPARVERAEEDHQRCGFRARLVPASFRNGDGGDRPAGWSGCAALYSRSISLGPGVSARRWVGGTTSGSSAPGRACSDARGNGSASTARESSRRSHGNPTVGPLTSMLL
jgi:hypothetical protein